MKNAIENRNTKIKTRKNGEIEEWNRKKNICEKSFQLKPWGKNWKTNKDQRQRERQWRITDRKKDKKES